MSKNIGNMLGELLDIDLIQDGVIGYPNFLRIKVILPIEELFPTGFNTQKSGGLHLII